MWEKGLKNREVGKKAKKTGMWDLKNQGGGKKRQKNQGCGKKRQKNQGGGKKAKKSGMWDLLTPYKPTPHICRLSTDKVLYATRLSANPKKRR
jgi:hypothetical protein